MKRSNHFKWIGPVHEYLEVGGIFTQLKFQSFIKKAKKISHPTAEGRNLRIYENRLKKGEKFTPGTCIIMQMS